MFTNTTSVLVYRFTSSDKPRHTFSADGTLARRHIQLVVVIFQHLCLRAIHESIRQVSGVTRRYQLVAHTSFSSFKIGKYIADPNEDTLAYLCSPCCPHDLHRTRKVLLSLVGHDHRWVVLRVISTLNPARHMFVDIILRGKCRIRTSIRFG